ncbi:hypothetical protein MUP79_10270 [Candidatus Bathyarchaeota archaeon]|nr:hypothetical protein [Candidatus Bathyarchaeota archaeon]
MRKPAHIKHIHYIYMDNGMGQWHSHNKSLILHKSLKQYPILHAAVIKHELRHSRIQSVNVLGFDTSILYHIAIDVQDMFKIHALPEFWEFIKVTTNHKWWHFLTGYDQILYSIVITIIAVFSNTYGSIVTAMKHKR